MLDLCRAYIEEESNIWSVVGFDLHIRLKTSVGSECENPPDIPLSQSAGSTQNQATSLTRNG